MRGREREAAVWEKKRQEKSCSVLSQEDFGLGGGPPICHSLAALSQRVLRSYQGDQRQ